MVPPCMKTTTQSGDIAERLLKVGSDMKFTDDIDFDMMLMSKVG